MEFSSFTEPPQIDSFEGPSKLFGTVLSIYYFLCSYKYIHNHPIPSLQLTIS